MTIIDEDAGLAYMATHQQITIKRIALESGVRQNVAGEPMNLNMVGPTAGARGRGVGDAGRVAYFSTDGSIKNSLSGVVMESKVLRREFPAICCLP